MSVYFAKIKSLKYLMDHSFLNLDHHIQIYALIIQTIINHSFQRNNQFAKSYLFMTDILPNLGLSKLFSTRIRHYLLFLEVAHNIELICQVTDYLEIRDILNFLSSSNHLYSFRKITAIEVRLLKAKVDYYEKPKIQPTFQTFIKFLHIKVPTTQTKLKSCRLARDHECLKKFNKEMGLSKQSKKLRSHQVKATFSQNSSKQISNSLSEYGIEGQKSLISIQSQIVLQRKEYKEKIQKMIKDASIRSERKDQSTKVNPYQERLKEVEYQVARKHLEKRKTKRIQQEKEIQHAITMQQLKKMAKEDPCSRQTLKKIQSEEIQRIQRANVAKLKMKSVKFTQQQIQKIKIIQKQQSKKISVAKPPIYKRIISTIKGLIIKQ